MTANKSISHQRAAVPRQRLRLRDVIRRRLVECGWCKQVQILCEEIIKENEGRNVSFDTLLTKILPHAREMVPLSFNEDLHEELKTTELADDYEDEEEDILVIDILTRNRPSDQQRGAPNQPDNASNQQEIPSNQPEDAPNQPGNASNP